MLHSPVSKNVTITLDQELAEWAKVMAAKNNKSLSKYIASILESICSSTGSDSIIEDFQAFKPRELSMGQNRAFNREEIYRRND